MLDAAALVEGRFTTSFNCAAFAFSHGLHREPLYDLPSLLALAKRLGPASAYWSTRPVTIGDGWEDQRAREWSLEEAVEGVENADTLIVLKDIELDPVYGPVFRRVVEDMAAVVGPMLQNDALHGRATLLVSSPRRITGYHIDAEANFLMQLRGEKTVHVFDGSDRTLVSRQDLERFYAGDLNAAPYWPDRQGEALTLGFKPGDGVHVPIGWPHWVQNGDNVSVSISINYDLRSNLRQSRVFRFNHRLRRLGFNPTDPGQSPLRDGGKAALFAGIEGVRQLRRKAG